MDEKTTDYDGAATCWHLIVTTNGGAVCMLKSLDAPTARQAYQSLLPDRHPVTYINTSESGSWPCGRMRSVYPYDVKSVDIIGPVGATLDPWRDVEPRIIVDMMLERIRLYALAQQAANREQKAEEMAAGLNVIPELAPVLSPDGFRCGCCDKHQPAESLLYYLPDGLDRSSPLATIRALISANKWSGSFSGWCAQCAPKEHQGEVADREALPKPKWWQW